MNGLTSRGLHDQLVESEAFATGLSDSGAGSLSETKRSHRELGDL